MGGMATEGGARAGGSVRGPRVGGFIRGTELEIRGLSAAGGGGGGRELERRVPGGSWLFLVDSPSLTRWKLMQRPCRDTGDEHIIVGRRFKCRLRASVPIQRASSIHGPKSALGPTDRGVCAFVCVRLRCLQGAQRGFCRFTPAQQQL